MFWERDIDTFFSDFAVDAVFIRAGVAPRNIRVLFDEDYKTIMDELVGVEGAASSAICRTSDVRDAVHNDTLVIGGITYFIVGIQPDGTGVTILLLSRNRV
ncbi:MAG: hypothetical protein DDT18_01725 [Actinobacteria bacterium]|nr:hypothetical protein [Actinomycetota bacterium]